MKGMATTRNPTNFNNFTFLNRELQVETGLVDLTNRQYDPQRGQFTSQDEIIEGQEDLTLYQYGWNNPVLKSDPDGQYPGEGIVNTILNWLSSKPSESDKKLGEIYSYNAYNGHSRTPQTNGQIVVDAIASSIQVIGQEHRGGIAMTRAVLRRPPTPHAETPTVSVVRRTGPRGVNKDHHNANVRIVNSDNKTVKVERVVSGNMTPEEKSLGFPLNTLASHTEARAVRNNENVSLLIEKGNQMIITGQQAPCPSCKGKMNQVSTQTGTPIIYQWREDGETKIGKSKINPQ
jgi:RHS repeat-associated protein